MGDAAGDVCSILCGGCCIIFFSSLTAYCGTKRYGSGSGSGTAGCCGRCCKDSFDEDAFEEQVKKDLAKTRDPNAKQPEPVNGMSQTTLALNSTHPSTQPVS